mmetsp:Transcript_78254/g.197570  ORF Transcript_78254/g.197570 Transcript_78254/m.197570 type:complete len:99 (+) Transcript_78254:426-722(+)
MLTTNVQAIRSITFGHTHPQRPAKRPRITCKSGWICITLHGEFRRELGYDFAKASSHTWNFRCNHCLVNDNHCSEHWAVCHDASTLVKGSRASVSGNC